jgi:hypothetical protein
MIYKEYFITVSNHWSKSAPQPPSLLAAVWSKVGLYHKILEAYYQDYKFMPWSQNEEGFDKNVSMEQVRSMRHLRLGHQGLEGTALNQFDSTRKYGERSRSHSPSQGFGSRLSP